MAQDSPVCVNNYFSPVGRNSSPPKFSFVRAHPAHSRQRINDIPRVLCYSYNISFFGHCNDILHCVGWLVPWIPYISFNIFAVVALHLVRINHD
jgi:hypothetical protein